MATIPYPPRVHGGRSNPLGIILAAIALLLALSGKTAQISQPPLPPCTRGYDIPGVGRVMAGTHADARHGLEAQQARDLVVNHPWQPCRLCQDGRWRCLGYHAGEWGLVVIENLTERTAFKLSESQARLVAGDCQPPSNGHDNFISGAAY